MVAVSEEHVREYDCEAGFPEIEKLRANYARFIVGFKRQIFTGGRSALSQMVGALEMTPEALYGIEESTRRWCGGGTYYATVSTELGQPLLRLRYEVQGPPVPYRGPGSDHYVDDGIDVGIVHLPTRNKQQRLQQQQHAAPAGAATEPVQLLERQMTQSNQQTREEALRRDRELEALRRQLEDQRSVHATLLERTSKERSEADQRTTQVRLEALQEEIRRMRDQPVAAPPRAPIDWIGLATAVAPIVTIATALITAGTERQKLLAQQRDPQPPRSLLGELKDIMAIPGMSKLAEKVFSGGGNGEDKLALFEALAETQMAHISMFRDVMRELEPKGDPVAVQVTRMIGDGLQKIAQIIERARGGAPALQQQTAQQQPTQQQEQEHVAEVVEQDPAVQELQAAFDKFPGWMKTQDWAAVLQECWKCDRNVVHSDHIDMIAALVVQLVQNAVGADAVDKSMSQPDEKSLTELATLLMPYSEDHATALFRTLTRLFSVNKSAPGPSVVQPRPQERVGGPGEVVPFRR